MKNKYLHTASAPLLVPAVFSAAGITEGDPHLLSVEAKKDFLLNAWVIKAKRTGEGITSRSSRPKKANLPCFIEALGIDYNLYNGDR